MRLSHSVLHEPVGEKDPHPFSQPDSPDPWETLTYTYLFEFQQRFSFFLPSTHFLGCRLGPTCVRLLFPVSGRYRYTPRRMKNHSKSFPNSLLNWYDTNRRDLPWRAKPGDQTAPEGFAVLVSELMLQQTQVATVVPYFLRFMARFPTAGALAEATEQEVLRHWQGLGYYSRARNLHAAARIIVQKHEGRVPASMADLIDLPGVGRYTAGAVASIAFGIKAPILDGNVARVLCRLNKITTDPRAPATQKKLWQLAEEILPEARVGDFNSALMELGATICTPRSPRCLLCPVKDFCQAFAAGVQEEIPAPRIAKPTPEVHRWTLCVKAGDDWLIEQRPATGRWASLWQFPTIEAGDKKPTAGLISRELKIPVANVHRIGEIRHALTHRRYVFEVFTAQIKMAGASKKSFPGGSTLTRAWVRLDQLDRYPLPRPHLTIAQMLSQPRA
jgi:A/G-specific adenine glycosylase